MNLNRMTLSHYLYKFEIVYEVLKSIFQYSCVPDFSILFHQLYRLFLLNMLDISTNYSVTKSNINRILSLQRPKWQECHEADRHLLQISRNTSGG